MRSLGQEPTDQELQDMMKKVDTDNNGTITFSEFVTMLTPKTSNTDRAESMTEAFQVFDTEGNGLISAPELKRALESLGAKHTDAEIDELIEQAGGGKGVHGLIDCKLYSLLGEMGCSAVLCGMEIRD